MNPEIPSERPNPTMRAIERKPILRGIAHSLTVTATVLILLFVAGPVASAQDTSTLLVLRPVTAKLKKGEKSHQVITTPLVQSDVAEIKIGGKPVTITAWTPLLKGTYGLQIMILMDSMERIGVNEEFDDIKKFIGGLPPNVEIGVGYLLQGKAKITQVFTTDRKLAGDALKEPQDVTLPKNDNGNPYACLRDLAAHWPNPDPKKLRAVLMITDGIIRNNATPQGRDALNPDVDAANQALTRAGIMPFPLFYLDPVPADPNRSEGGQLEGQQNMDQLATGAQGQALFDGQFAPATFAPLLDRMYTILNSMAVATIDVKGSGFKTVDVKSSRDDIGVQAPDSITIGNVLKTK